METTTPTKTEYFKLLNEVVNGDRHTVAKAYAKAQIQYELSPYQLQVITRAFKKSIERFAFDIIHSIKQERRNA